MGIAMTDEDHMVGGLVVSGIVLMFAAAVWLWGPLALMVAGATLIILSFVVAGKQAARRRQS